MWYSPVSFWFKSFRWEASGENGQESCQKWENKWGSIPPPPTAPATDRNWSLATMRDLKFRPVDKSKYSSVKSSLGSHVFALCSNETKKQEKRRWCQTCVHRCTQMLKGGVLFMIHQHLEQNVHQQGQTQSWGTEVKSLNLFVSPSNCIPLHR